MLAHDDHRDRSAFYRRARGYFYAFDARNGELFVERRISAVSIVTAPITYEIDGKQFVLNYCGQYPVNLRLAGPTFAFRIPERFYANVRY